MSTTTATTPAQQAQRLANLARGRATQAANRAAARAATGQPQGDGGPPIAAGPADSRTPTGGHPDPFSDLKNTIQPLVLENPKSVGLGEESHKTDARAESETPGGVGENTRESGVETGGERVEKNSSDSDGLEGPMSGKTAIPVPEGVPVKKWASHDERRKNRVMKTAGVAGLPRSGGERANQDRAERKRWEEEQAEIARIKAEAQAIEDAKGPRYERAKLYPKQEACFFGAERWSLTEATAQPLDATIWTPAGPKRMADMAIGDRVLTPTGTAQVVGVFPQGLRDIYRVTFKDGSSCECTADHLWEVHADRPNNRKGFARRLRANPEMKRRKDRIGWPRVMAIGEMTKRFTKRAWSRMWIPLAEPCHFDAREVPLNPWFVGVLLGDGGLSGDSIKLSSSDSFIVERVRGIIPDHYALRREGDCDYMITLGANAPAYFRKAGTLLAGLRELGMMGKRSYEKSIPEIYLRNSMTIRWEVMRGLMDTDGYVNHKGQPCFETTSEKLARNFVEMAEGLGASCSLRYKAKNHYLKNGVRVACRPVWRIAVRCADAARWFSLPRKIASCSVKKKRLCRTFRSVEFIRHDRAQCIAIDDSRGLYLTDRHIVTHNTKGGKTSGAIVWLAEKAILGKEGQNFWWVAPVFPQAEVAYRRMAKAFPYDLRATHDSKMRISLANGTAIWFKSGETPDNLYGEDVYAAVVDEASRLREESWYALRSTLTATKGQARMIGNVKGRRNWFYAMCRKAEGGEPNMAYHKLTWRDAVEAGVIDAREIDDARSLLPPAVFQELYEADAADDSGNPFGLEAIAECVAKCGGLVSTDPVTCWGWDLGKRQDWSCGVGLDRLQRVAQVERFQMPWREAKERIAKVTARLPALVDSTGVGDVVLEDLQATGSNFEGYYFTGKSKQELMNHLRNEVQGRRIAFPDGVIRTEMEQFEYEYTRTAVLYSAPPGCHDDAVIGLALASKHFATHGPGHFQFARNEKLARGSYERGGRERAILI